MRGRSLRWERNEKKAVEVRWLAGGSKVDEKCFPLHCLAGKEGPALERSSVKRQRRGSGEEHSLPVTPTSPS